MNYTARTLLFPCLLVLTFWLSQEFIYVPFVVPRLITWTEVPIAWVVAVFAPEVIVCIFATLSFHRLADALVFCTLGAFSITGCQFLAGLLHQPGNHKAIEGGLTQFGLQLFLVTMLLAVVVGVLSLIRFGIGRVRAG